MKGMRIHADSSQAVIDCAVHCARDLRACRQWRPCCLRRQRSSTFDHYITVSGSAYDDHDAPRSHSSRISTATPSIPGRESRPKQRGTAPARPATATRQSTAFLARSLSERLRFAGPAKATLKRIRRQGPEDEREASRLPVEAGEDGVNDHRRRGGNHRRTALRGVCAECDRYSRRARLRLLHLRPTGEGSGDAGLVPVAREGRLVRRVTASGQDHLKSRGRAHSDAAPLVWTEPDQTSMSATMRPDAAASWSAR